MVSMVGMNEVGSSWLPARTRAALCLSIDDIHPAKSSDYYEAGGDLSKGVLGRVEWLLARHPRLRVTLFVTADWREISPVPTRKLLASIPYLRDRLFLAKRWPQGTMRLDRHPQFVAYLKQLPRTEIGFHGLYHCSTGKEIPVEFQHQDTTAIKDMLAQMVGIFQQAGLPFVPGMCPPGWNAPLPLLHALADTGMTFVASARDIFTPIARTAVTNMSGLKGVSLIYPERVLDGRLIHLPANFNPTRTFERATAILDCAGLLSIKAHAVKQVMGFTAYDGLDEIYANYLDLLLSRLEDRYGDSLWWTSMGEIAQHVLGTTLQATGSA
jgi:uncharacterized protein DUF2334